MVLVWLCGIVCVGCVVVCGWVVCVWCVVVCSSWQRLQICNHSVQNAIFSKNIVAQTKNRAVTCKQEESD